MNFTTLNPRNIIKIPNFRIVLRPKDKKFILKKIQEVLASNRWTAGRQNAALEEAFEKHIGFPYAAAVNNGGAGLVAVLQGLGLPKGSLILCPTLTAAPTAHAILAAGMRVVFADSSLDDLGLDLGDVKRKLDIYKDKIRAVICVHIGGWISPRIGELNKLCKKYGVYLVEDCAHAIGSSLRGNAAGSTGIAAVYSLFMTKPLTCGEGGIVIARDKKLIESIKIIRNYGKDQNGRHVCKGFNYKLSEFDAAVALWAIKNAGYIITERQRQAALYDELLSNLGGASIFKIPKVSCSYYKYILILKDKINRDRLKRVLLNDYGIEVAGGVYDTLCHQEPYFQSVGSKVLNYKEIFPHSEEFSKRQVCLPLYLGLKKSGQKYVAESVFRALKKCGIPIKNQALLT